MICRQMGKTSHKAKTPLSKFKVTTLKNPLINNQTVTSMRNLTTTLAYPKIPTYSWTFASIPNWTWSWSRVLSLVKINNFSIFEMSIKCCESVFFRILRPKDPRPEWKGRIWWTGPWLTAANGLFKNQVNAKNTPDNIQKNDKQGYRRVSKN